MSSSLLTLADAVTCEINSPVLSGSFTGWSQIFKATRKNVPRRKAEEFNGLQVTVRPKDRQTTRGTRSIMQDLMRVYVGIQQKQTSDDNEESDPLIDLGEEIQNYFDQKRPLAQLPVAVCEASSFGADTDSTWLGVQNQNEILLYTGLIVLTFRVMRPGAA